MHGAIDGTAAGPGKKSRKPPAFALTRRGWQAVGQLRARAHAQLLVDPREVAFDGAGGDEELRGDVLVRPALGDELGDSAFGLGQFARCDAYADAGALRTCPLRPERSRKLVEDRDRRVECLARGAFLLA